MNPVNANYLINYHLQNVISSSVNNTKVISVLNTSKTQLGHDKINIRMLKICGDTISRSLEIIFK